MWKYPNIGNAYDLYIGHKSPVVTDNIVIAPADSGIVAIRPENGGLIWKRELGALGSPVISNDRIFLGTASAAGGPLEFYSFGTPSPTVNSLTENQTISGTIRIEGTALGDTVSYGGVLQAVELNFGSGWISSTSLEENYTRTYDSEGLVGYDTLHYVNNWSHDWNSRSVPNGTVTVRARVLYTNGAYSDETTLTLQVENPPLTVAEIGAIAGVMIVAFAVVFWLKRR